MSDDTAMPYEKAIEETAKATNNAVDLFREGGRAIGPAIGDIYGFLIGDKLGDARKRRLDKIARETKKILHDRDVKEQLELPEDIAMPLLEAAQGESREELQELWARLLANAMDPSRAQNVRPEYIDIVRKLHPVDVGVLTFIDDRLTSNATVCTVPQISQQIKLRASAAEVSVEHLINLECVRLTGGNHLVTLTDLGKELMIAVAP